MKFPKFGKVSMDIIPENVGASNQSSSIGGVGVAKCDHPRVMMSMSRTSFRSLGPRVLRKYHFRGFLPKYHFWGFLPDTPTGRCVFSKLPKIVELKTILDVGYVYSEE